LTTSETPPGDRFRDQQIVFANGIKGTSIDVPSASPTNFHQVISTPSEMPSIVIDGKLFLPEQVDSPLPLIIVVPGSLGVAPSHIAHAESLNAAGFATFVLDCFGARHVTSTVANQTQFSFAASAYDILATVKVLAELPEIDQSRIGAQGHSRGGSAVLTAVTRRFADAVIGENRGLSAVLAAYPWCGQQFLNPGIGTSEIRVLMGDADEWCSPLQAQGYCQAIRLSGGRASLRLIGGAQHSFDRGTPVELIADASVTPAAPVTYLADDGAMMHPLHGTSDSSLVDRDVMLYAVKAGFGVKGARIGSNDGEAQLFHDDMMSYWKRVLKH
jgi:dienelactone hydrolase